MHVARCSYSIGFATGRPDVLPALQGGGRQVPRLSEYSRGASSRCRSTSRTRCGSRARRTSTTTYVARAARARQPAPAEECVADLHAPLMDRDVRYGNAVIEGLAGTASPCTSRHTRRSRRRLGAVSCDRSWTRSPSAQAPPGALPKPSTRPPRPAAGRALHQLAELRKLPVQRVELARSLAGGLGTAVQTARDTLAAVTRNGLPSAPGRRSTCIVGAQLRLGGVPARAHETSHARTMRRHDVSRSQGRRPAALARAARCAAAEPLKRVRSRPASPATPITRSSVVHEHRPAHRRGGMHASALRAIHASSVRVEGRCPEDQGDDAGDLPSVACLVVGALARVVGLPR